MATETITDNYFVRDLRRVLWLAEIFKTAAETLRMNPGASGDLCRPVLEVEEKIDRLYNRLFKLSPQTWPAVFTDIKGDMPQDILLLIDTVSDVKNLPDIITILQESKVKEAA